jgi:hypothetical protein
MSEKWGRAHMLCLQIYDRKGAKSGRGSHLTVMPHPPRHCLRNAIGAISCFYQPSPIATWFDRSGSTLVCERLVQFIEGRGVKIFGAQDVRANEGERAPQTQAKARQASSHEHTREVCREKNRNALVTTAESYDFVRYRG